MITHCVTYYLYTFFSQCLLLFVVVSSIFWFWEYIHESSEYAFVSTRINHAVKSKCFFFETMSYKESFQIPFDQLISPSNLNELKLLKLSQKTKEKNNNKYLNYKLQILTHSSSNGKHNLNLCLLMMHCTFNNLQCKVLGLHTKWTGYKDKWISVHNEIKNGNYSQNTIFLFVDAFDSLVVGSSKQIIHQFLHLNRTNQIIFNAGTIHMHCILSIFSCFHDDIRLSSKFDQLSPMRNFVHFMLDLRTNGG